MISIQERIDILQQNLAQASKQAVHFQEMKLKYQGALEILVEYANDVKAEESKVGEAGEGLEVSGDEVDEVLATLGGQD